MSSSRDMSESGGELPAGNDQQPENARQWMARHGVRNFPGFPVIPRPDVEQVPERPLYPYHERAMITHYPPPPPPEPDYPWAEQFPDWRYTGTGYTEAWDSEIDPGRTEHYKQLMRSRGYEFKKLLFSDKDVDPIDHQVHVVTKTFDLGPGEPPLVKEMACKIMCVGYFQRIHRYVVSATRALLHESDVLLRCQHPNIVQAYECVHFADTVSKFPHTFAAVVMELMDGSLPDLMAKFAPNCILPEWYCKLWVRDIANALYYLHNRLPGKTWTATHMALIPRNILYRVLDPEQDKFVFKLCDFEETYLFEEGQEDRFPGYAVRNPYRHFFAAPELFEADKRGQVSGWLNTGWRTHPFDMYALGRCIQATYLGNGGLQDPLVRPNPDAEDLIESLLDDDQRRRPTPQLVLAHPWLADV